MTASSTSSSFDDTVRRLRSNDPTLTSLSLSDNNLGERGGVAMAEALKLNSTLTFLVLGRNDLGERGGAAMAEALKVNSTLTSLDLVYNNVGERGGAAMAEALKVNSTLTSLDLVYNNVGERGGVAMAEALKVNSTLTSLDLQWNKLGERGGAAMAEALKVNSTLTSLNLGGNKLGERGGVAMAEALKVNSTLTSLNLGGNKLGERGGVAIAEALKVNSTLTSLDLENNLINDRTIDAINQMISFNKFLKDPSYSLEKTFKSPYPFITSSNILYIPFQTYPRKFTTIDLRNQPHLHIIPPNFGHLDPTFTTTILMDVENLLPSMRPFAKNASTIIQYAKALLDGTLINLNQVKLMVVGRAATGKTTLVRRFYGQKFHASLQSTDGIDLGDFVYEGMRFSTWDFGGQKVYRYTHQLFLGDNTIYLLLFKLNDSLSATLSELRFWLNSIAARTKNPTVILVGTHLDQVKKHGIDVNPLIQTILQTLAQEYPNLIDGNQTPVFQVSSVPGGEATLTPLLARLVEVAQRVQVRAPKSFAVAEEYFSSIKNERNPPVVTYQEVMTALREKLSAATTDEEIVNTLMLLSDFGSVSVFHQPRTPTQGLIVLRPQWITTLFASLITTHHTFVGADTGTITQEDILRQIWKDTEQYPPEKHQAFLHVLTELQVIFPFVERGRVIYFIPCRLREEPPDLSHWLSPRMLADHPLHYQRIFRLAYSVPIAIIPPLLIELLRRGELLARWQQGGVARVVEAHGQTLWIHVWRSAAQEITLSLWGQSIKSCAPWLRSLSMLIENRLKEFYHIAFETLIPCTNCTSGENGFFAESKIHRAIVRDQNLVACDGKVPHRMRIDHLAPDLLYQDLNDEGFLFEYHRFDMIKSLGSGAFGQVYLMSLTQFEDKADHHLPISSSSSISPSPKTTQYAVKTLDRGMMADLSQTEVFLEFKREVFLMSTLDHPFVLRLFGICTNPLAMVMEVAAGGDLYAQLTDPLGLQSKIFKYVTAVKQHLAAYLEGPANIHRVIYVIEKSTALPRASLTHLKQSCQAFLQTQSEILKNRQIDVNQISCPLQFILQLKESNPRDKILEALQIQYTQDHLGLEQAVIESAICVPLLPLDRIGTENAYQSAQNAFEEWTSLAIGQGLHADQIHQLAVTFCSTLENLHQNPKHGAGYKQLETLLDQIQSLEKEQRSSLVPISFPLQLKLAAEIVLGMEYLHSLQPPMVHRDLKTLNIFLTRSLIDFPLNNVGDPAWKAPLTKVADFGLSVRMVRSGQLQIRDRNDNDPLLNINATWAAPELLRGEHYSSAIDVYAIGIIMWELLMREAPFNEIPLQDAIKSSILQGYRPLIPQSILDQPRYTEYIKLMQRCWAQHPEGRPSMTMVYQDLMTIIGANPTTRFLTELLPPPQSLGVQEELALPRQPFQVHPIEIPFTPFQVKTKDELSHITCMIAPFQTEEFWFGFGNGMVAHARYEESTNSLDVLACQVHDRHPSRVNALVYCIGQGEHGTIWSGSEDGLLSVWSAQREECGDHFDNASFKSDFLIFSGQEEKPLHSSLKRKLFGRKNSLSHRYHVEFEHGQISFYRSQSKLHPKMRLNFKTDITNIEFQTKSGRIYLSHQTGDRLLIFAPLDDASLSKMTEYYRQMMNAFSALQCDQPLKLKRLTGRQFLRKEAAKVGIQSLLALDHTVLCATHDFSVSEWRLTSTADAHGLHETYALEPGRSFQLDVMDMKPRLQVMLGFLRVNQRTLWFAVGNRWMVFDLDQQATVPSQLTSSSNASLSQSLSNSTAVSSVFSVHDDKMISLLLVRRTLFDQIYTGDEAGRVIVWHPEPAPLRGDTSETAPLLMPVEHRLLNLTQPPSPVEALAYLHPNHIWFGTSHSELISWNLATQVRDDDDAQPFAHHPLLRPHREITLLTPAQDARGSAVVWCLSREKKFLRFSGLKSLYHAYQEPIGAEFEVEVGHLQREGQPIGSGGFGRVYRGRYFNKPVAIKVLHHILNMTALTQEISSWCTFCHPHVLLLIGYATKPEGVIVMELMDCSLYDVLYHGAPPDLPACLWMARGVAAGLSYLHARQAVHQDLKSLNVLLRGYGQQAHFDVKIADFGATKPMELLDESSEKVLSLYWSAPELFSSYATTASDVYAMGMVFYELFMKEIPFREVRTLEALKEKVCQHQVRPTMNPARMGLSPIVAKPIMDLITACWQHEPYRRPIAAAVLQQLNEASFTELSTGHVEKVSMSITSSSATTTPQQTINYANFSSIDYDFSSSTIRSNQTIHDDEFTSAHFDFSTLSASQSYPF